MEDLNLLSLISVDLQTLHLHPITGTPCDVPVPKNVIRTYLLCFIFSITQIYIVLPDFHKLLVFYETGQNIYDSCAYL
ncbi:MAG: hypothetical protein Kow0068_21880 [Marinilabiliales bacterium]